MDERTSVTLSVVIPVYMEQDNIPFLIERVHFALNDYPNLWELIIVDDGSMDATVRQLYACRERFGDHVRVLELQRNFGQTAAMQAGIDAARGECIATLDGDLQNDPMDIPRLVRQLLDKDLDMLQGWRQQRKDNWLIRKFPSRIANRLIARITGVKLQDYGCSLKVYRARILKQIRLFGEMHRFIPVWVASVTQPERIGEAPVRHHARVHGRSKYGLSRTFRVLIDLLSVFFFLKFRARPGHFFGYVGLWLGGIATVIMGYLAYAKFISGEDIGSRPLFFVGILLSLAALQFCTTGLLAEMLSRVLFETSQSKGYQLRTPIVTSADQHWCQPETAILCNKAG